ncbi:MAG: adenosine deaminase [Blastocatellia bacterium]|jgi:adenosine deaminase/adenosine deaminase CECR1|nr:adenosine deaminase [Blastocatellia bacterium]
MRGIFSLRSRLVNAIRTLPLLLLCVFAQQAQPRETSTRGSIPAEQRTARYFESIRKSPPQELAFLLRMPKGGDLHTHLSGAVYAESYIQWAADNGLCINTRTMALSAPKPPAKCDPKSDQAPAGMALTSSSLYGKMIDAWSMRNWQLSGQSGHDHFFDTFSKFGPATWNQNGRMLAEVVARAARGQVLYLELMLTPDGTTTGVMSSQIADKVVWNGNFESMLSSLKSNGIDDAAALGIKSLQAAEAEKDRLLKCGTAQADVGCAVTVRYIAQVSRGGGLSQVFAQMVTGFALSNNPNSKVVALNLVQPEDSLASMQNFSVQMQMLSFLRPMYPQAHISLHAGELAPGMVTPDGLTFHIRDSVMVAHADRIGHGVDIMHETDPYELLKELARRQVMVEICLSSNQGILGISGPQHPLATYVKYGVPVALATDDEGVSRSEISREFLKAAEDQGLGYLQLKTMARNSLQYAFIAGGSLWSDSRKFASVEQCTQDTVVMKLTSTGCRQYLDNNQKAKLQWRLEEEFREFERGW